MHRKIITIAAVLALLGATGMAVGSVSAQEAGNRQITLIQRLTEKFNLDQEAVEQVFEEHRQEHRQQREAMLEDRLSEAVEEGSITQEQMDTLLQMHEQHHQNKPSSEELSQMSPEERRALFRSHREQIREWAQEQGIDLKEIMPFSKGGQMRNR